jgi:hypothetical protein
MDSQSSLDVVPVSPTLPCVAPVPRQTGKRTTNRHPGLLQEEIAKYWQLCSDVPSETWIGVQAAAVVYDAFVGTGFIGKQSFHCGSRW